MCGSKNLECCFTKRLHPMGESKFRAFPTDVTRSLSIRTVMSPRTPRSIYRSILFRPLSFARGIGHGPIVHIPGHRDRQSGDYFTSCSGDEGLLKVEAVLDISPALTGLAPSREAAVELSPGRKPWV